MRTKIIFAILLFFVSNPYTISDTLYLKNGGTVEGIIEESGDYYIVNLGYGTANFHKSTVSEVKYSSSGEREQIREDWVKQKAESRSKPAATPQREKRAEEPPKHMEIEEAGQRIDITKYVVKGKITIFDFYSEYCGPCMAVAPRLERLVQTRDDIVVRKININRPSVRGIDWDSPVVKQHNIKFVPYFKIYNERGNTWLEGKSASDKVYSWLE